MIRHFHGVKHQQLGKMLCAPTHNQEHTKHSADQDPTMASFLSKLFKPKWQSANKHIRIEAIKQLDPSSDEDLEILTKIAKEDVENDVKVVAVEQIQDPNILSAIHADAADTVQNKVEVRLKDIASAQSLSLFDLITDAKILTSMIVATTEAELFINGLARLEDQDALLAIASTAKTSKIRQAAAELLNSEELLRTLAASAKSKDKSVYQIAKTKLENIRSFQKQQTETNERIAKLLNGVQDLAKTDNTNLYESNLSSLKQRWETVKHSANETQRQSFDQSAQACQERIDIALQEQADQAHAAQLALANGDEQQAAVMTLEESGEQLKTKAASTAEIPAIDALIKTQETRWLEATRDGNVEKSLHKRYQQSMGVMRHYLNALKALQEHNATLTSKLQQISQKKKKTDALSEEAKALQNALSSIQWPLGFDEPELIRASHDALEQSNELKKTLVKNAAELEKSIQQDIEQLDQRLSEKQIKASSESLKKIQKSLKQLDGKRQDKVNQQLTLRIKQLNELRDWQGYASAPRQIELCEQMERLAAQTLPPQEKADKIKALQNEWKQLGGARDESLWERFKTAADKAFEPCKAYFEEQSKLKAGNLERRQTLIQQLEEFVSKNNWDSPDWKAIEQINRKARQEWRDAFPVDHKQNRAIQKQFNAVLDQLDKHLSEERTKNLELKAEVVEKAKALIDESDLQIAIEQAKLLQKEWQGIGITEHKKDRSLWQEFRKICDEVFARRDQARDAKREEADQASEALENLLSEIETFAKTALEQDEETLKTKLNEFRKSFKVNPSISRSKAESFNVRYEESLKTIKSAIKKLESAAVVLGWNEVARRASLLRDLYLQSSLSEEEITRTEQALVTEQASYKALEDKLKTLWISIKAGSVKQDFIRSEDVFKELCIRSEIAAGIDSPEEDNAMRMQLQVSRLSEGITASRTESREERLTNLLEEWYTSVGLSSDALAPLEQRVQTATRALFES